MNSRKSFERFVFGAALVAALTCIGSRADACVGGGEQCLVGVDTCCGASDSCGGTPSRCCTDGTQHGSGPTCCGNGQDYCPSAGVCLLIGTCSDFFRYSCSGASC